MEPQIPLGELTALLQTNWILGVLLLRGGCEGKERGRGRGERLRGMKGRDGGRKWEKGGREDRGEERRPSGFAPPGKIS